MITDTLEILLNLNLFPTVINVIVIEYVFSLYKEKKIKEISHISLGGIITTIKNQKLYTFHNLYAQLSISNINDFNEKHKLKFSFYNNCNKIDNDEKYIYVCIRGYIHKFDHSGFRITKMKIPVIYLTMIGQYIKVFKNIICMYDPLDKDGKIFFFNTQKKNVKKMKVDGQIMCSKIIDNVLYVLLDNTTYSNYKFLKISSDCTILESYYLFETEYRKFEKFILTKDELYALGTFEHTIYVYDHYGNYSRSIDSVIVHDVITDDKNVYLFHGSSVNKLISVYSREKVKIKN